MNTQVLLENLGIRCERLKVKGNTVPRYMCRVDSESIESIIEKLKSAGFKHFVALTCVDWIKDGEFELLYHLFSYESREDVFLSVRIPRDAPIMKTLRHLFPQIETYEREIHEMFGVEFEGNDRLGEFILEDWDDMPPMRKDFDTEEYAKRKYYSVPLVDEGDGK